MEIREILEDLCHNTMGNPPYRIDQALALIQSEIAEENKKWKEELLGEINKLESMPHSLGKVYLVNQIHNLIEKS
jgi:hypothetical protein